MRGRYLKSSGLGELPSTPLNDNGALALAPPYGIPPTGNMSAPQMQGGMRLLGDNQSVWQFITFTAKADAIMLQSQTYRKFLIIQNKSGAGAILIGFGYVPTLSNALVLEAGVAYEPYNYPVNEIYVRSSGPDVDGLLIFGV